MLIEILKSDPRTNTDFKSLNQCLFFLQNKKKQWFTMLFIVDQGRINEAPNETRTHPWRFASLAW